MQRNLQIRMEFGKEITTETYELYKKALGDKMLNDKFDNTSNDHRSYGKEENAWTSF